MKDGTGASLVRYDAARNALRIANSVDEVKDIRDKAAAMAAYARQAKDTELVEWATEIKVRAERRAGEMLTDMAKSGKRASTGGDKKSSSQPTTMIPTLSDLNVSRDQSSRWQKLAAIPDKTFEAALAVVKEAAGGGVTTAAMLRLGAARSTTQTPAERKPLTTEEKRDIEIGRQILTHQPKGFAAATSITASLSALAKSCQQYDAAFVAGGIKSFEVAEVRGQIAIVKTWLDQLIINLRG